MLYKRGKVWWYEFKFAGSRIRESTKTGSKTLAAELQRKRRRDLESGSAGLRRQKVRLLKFAAKEWLDLKRHGLSPRSVKIEEANLKHLLPYFGTMLTSDIGAADIARYQQKRLGERAANQTVNLEVGTLRAILRRFGQWAAIQPEVKMLPARDDVGRAITLKEEEKLLGACAASRSKALFPAVLIALNTGLRYSELAGLRWRQVNIKGVKKKVTVGESKTKAGAGRVVPLNNRAFSALSLWSERFPRRQPEHFVFPSERYGQPGKKKSGVYDLDPTQPVGRLKEAWESAKRNARISCRWHDLRHTFCTRLLEAGHPFPLVAQIMGWSPSTAIRMARRYGHISTETLRPLVGSLDALFPVEESPQNSPQSEETDLAERVN